MLPITILQMDTLEELLRTNGTLNEQNSQILLKLVDEVKPDVVHIQFEPGMYGLLIDPKNPKNSGTYLDSFYRKCPIPITTTFHSGYNLSQWMSIASLIKKSGKIGR